MKSIWKVVHNRYVQWTIIGLIIALFLYLGIHAILVEDSKLTK